MCSAQRSFSQFSLKCVQKSARKIEKQTLRFFPTLRNFFLYNIMAFCRLFVPLMCSVLVVAAAAAAATGTVSVYLMMMAWLQLFCSKFLAKSLRRRHNDAPHIAIAMRLCSRILVLIIIRSGLNKNRSEWNVNARVCVCMLDVCYCDWLFFLNLLLFNQNGLYAADLFLCSSPFGRPTFFASTDDGDDDDDNFNVMFLEFDLLLYVVGFLSLIDSIFMGMFRVSCLQQCESITWPPLEIIRLSTQNKSLYPLKQIIRFSLLLPHYKWSIQQQQQQLAKKQ